MNEGQLNFQTTYSNKLLPFVTEILRALCNQKNMAETKYAPKGELVEIRYLIHELYNSSFSRAEKQMKVVTENDMTTDLVAELSQCDEQFNDLLVKYKDCKHRLQTKLRYSDEEMAMIIKTIGRSVIPYSFFCEVDGTTRSFLPNQLE